MGIVQNIVQRMAGGQNVQQIASALRLSEKWVGSIVSSDSFAVRVAREKGNCNVRH